MKKIIFVFLLVIMGSSICLAGDTQGPLSEIVKITNDTVKQLPSSVSDFEKTSYGRLIYWIIFWNYLGKDILVFLIVVLCAGVFWWLLFSKRAIEREKIAIEERKLNNTND